MALALPAGGGATEEAGIVQDGRPFSSSQLWSVIVAPSRCYWPRAVRPMIADRIGARLVRASGRSILPGRPSAPADRRVWHAAIGSRTTAGANRIEITLPRTPILKAEESPKSLAGPVSGSAMRNSPAEWRFNGARLGRVQFRWVQQISYRSCPGSHSRSSRPCGPPTTAGCPHPDDRPDVGEQIRQMCSKKMTCMPCVPGVRQGGWSGGA